MRGREIKQKRNKKSTHGHSVVIVGAGQGEWVEVEEGMGEINSDGKNKIKNNK